MKAYDCRLGIEYIQLLSKRYNVKFDINYRYKQLTFKSDIDWTVKVMGKKFTNPNFVECVREACLFVYEAYSIKDHL